MKLLEKLFGKKRGCITFNEEELRNYTGNAIRTFLRYAKNDGYHIMGDVDKSNYMKDWLDKFCPKE